MAVVVVDVQSGILGWVKLARFFRWHWVAQIPELSPVSRSTGILEHLCLSIREEGVNDITVTKSSLGEKRIWLVFTSTS